MFTLEFASELVVCIFFYDEWIGSACNASGCLFKMAVIGHLVFKLFFKKMYRY